MFNFKDEFEMEARDGNVYFVSVEGEQWVESGRVLSGVTKLEVFDELSELLDEDHPMMDEIKEEADSREYETELHSTDFSYYDLGETLGG